MEQKKVFIPAKNNSIVTGIITPKKVHIKPLKVSPLNICCKNCDAKFSSTDEFFKVEHVGCKAPAIQHYR